LKICGDIPIFASSSARAGGSVLLIFDQRAQVAGNNHVLGGLLLACIVMYWRLALIEECNTEATPEGPG